MKPLSSTHYDNVIRSDMLAKFEHKNIHDLAKVKSVHINHSNKQTVSDKKRLVYALIFLELLGGKRSGFTLARKSVAGFKLRKGVPIGTKISLRGSRIFSLIDSLHLQGFPIARGFTGLGKSYLQNDSCINIGIPDSFIISDVEVERFKDKSNLNIGGLNLSVNIPGNRSRSLRCLATAFRIPTKN